MRNQTQTVLLCSHAGNASQIFPVSISVYTSRAKHPSLPELPVPVNVL